MDIKAFSSRSFSPHALDQQVRIVFDVARPCYLEIVIVLYVHQGLPVEPRAIHFLHEWRKAVLSFLQMRVPRILHLEQYKPASRLEDPGKLGNCLILKFSRQDAAEEK